MRWGSMIVLAALGIYLGSQARVRATEATAGAESKLLILTGRIAETAELFATAQKTWGDHGCLTIRSAQRWEAIQRQLTDLGWKPPVKHALSDIHFDNRMIVLVFKNGDEADEFAVRHFDDGKTPALDVVMSYVIYKKRGEVVNRCNFIAVVVPLVEELKVSVSTFHPTAGGPHATLDDGLLEWRGVVGQAAGDVVDGLRGKIESNQETVAGSGGILVKFTLEYIDGAQVKTGQFASQRDSVWAWDGKYSNGYRNFAFEVRTPDGQSHFLRPKVIDHWNKNIPQPVEISAGKAYVLPGWVEGAETKSLKELGLDLAQSGTYTVTGVYLESGGPGKGLEAGRTLWGGNIATNTVTVSATAK